ncbi:VUT family protein [Azospirillum himalayense]|uniref:VUT family protein n=1 Tax=Azospirillum himalayense TaxID=654847 RepID=A0ABW0GC16_9PROT
MNRPIGFAALAAFATTIPAANWLIGNVGTTCVPHGPCLIPVAPGLAAPSGVLMIGAALVLRDMVQECLGRRWTITAIAVGTLLAGLFAPGPLVLASAMAFMLSEMADLAVYTPLRRRGLALAVTLSGLAGSVIDSAVFLCLAFGSLDFIGGQVVGKLWMTLAAGAVLVAFRQRANLVGGVVR